MSASTDSSLAATATVEGRGIVTGALVRLRFVPAAPNTGLAFRRTDLPEPVEIPVQAQSVTDTRLASTISRGQAKVLTIEHLMSALCGLGIDNVWLDRMRPKCRFWMGPRLPLCS